MGKRRQGRVHCFQKGRSKTNCHTKWEKARFRDHETRSRSNGFHVQRFRSVSRDSQREKSGTLTRIPHLQNSTEIIQYMKSTQGARNSAVYVVQQAESETVSQGFWVSRGRRNKEGEMSVGKAGITVNGVLLLKMSLLHVTQKPGFKEGKIGFIQQCYREASLMTRGGWRQETEQIVLTVPNVSGKGLVLAISALFRN